MNPHYTIPGKVGFAAIKAEDAPWPSFSDESGLYKQAEKPCPVHGKRKMVKSGAGTWGYVCCGRSPQ